MVGSTLELLVQIAAVHEAAVQDSIFERLVHIGRILPGEHLVDVKINIHGFVSHQRFTFPNREGGGSDE